MDPRDLAQHRCGPRFGRSTPSALSGDHAIGETVVMGIDVVENGPRATEVEITISLTSIGWTRNTERDQGREPGSLHAGLPEVAPHEVFHAKQLAEGVRAIFRDKATKDAHEQAAEEFGHAVMKSEGEPRGGREEE